MIALKFLGLSEPRLSFSVSTESDGSWGSPNAAAPATQRGLVNSSNGEDLPLQQARVAFAFLVRPLMARDRSVKLQHHAGHQLAWLVLLCCYQLEQHWPSWPPSRDGIPSSSALTLPFPVLIAYALPFLEAPSGAQHLSPAARQNSTSYQSAYHGCSTQLSPDHGFSGTSAMAH